MRIEESGSAIKRYNSVATELRSDKMGFARHNHPNSSGNLLPADLLSETIVLSVERPFVEACHIKDGIPQSLTRNSATVDGGSAYHGTFNDGDPFP